MDEEGDGWSTDESDLDLDESLNNSSGEITSPSIHPQQENQPPTPPAEQAGGLFSTLINIVAPSITTENATTYEELGQSQNEDNTINNNNNNDNDALIRLLQDELKIANENNGILIIENGDLSMKHEKALLEKEAMETTILDLHTAQQQQAEQLAVQQRAVQLLAEQQQAEQQQAEQQAEQQRVEEQFANMSKEMGDREATISTLQAEVIELGVLREEKDRAVSELRHAQELEAAKTSVHEDIKTLHAQQLDKLQSELLIEKEKYEANIQQLQSEVSSLQQLQSEATIFTQRSNEQHESTIQQLQSEVSSSVATISTLQADLEKAEVSERSERALMKTRMPSHY